MTSRNTAEGRYAGKFKGVHCRTHNTVDGKYKQEQPWCMHRLISLPAADIAWGILAAREHGMIINRIIL